MKTNSYLSVMMLTGLILLSLSIPSQAQSDYQPEHRVETNLPYDSRFQRQVVDVFLPDSDERLTDAGYPVLFMIHGGGYVIGSKDIMTATADYFAGQGFAAVTPNYRLGAYPAPIEDLACALAWTISNATHYHFDLTRLVILGESAGGNAAALLSAHDDLSRFTTLCPSQLPGHVQFAAVVPYYMYGDMTTCATACTLLKEATSFYLGQSLFSYATDQLQMIWGEASPLFWIDGSEAPTLAIHGLKDNVVPVSETVHYAEVLSDAGVSVETLYIPDAMHGFIEGITTEPSRIAREAVLTFLDRVLTPEYQVAYLDKSVVLNH